MMMAPSRQAHPSRSKERGGIVIIAALMLLTLLSVAAFSFSRTVLREIGVSGNVYQAGRADASADAGLDWFIAWENSVQKVGGTLPTSTSAPKAKAITDVVEKIYTDNRSVATTTSSYEWTNASSTDGMMLQGIGTTGSPTQAFNLKLICLGEERQAAVGETGVGNPSGDKNVGKNAGKLFAWEAVSTGQSILPGDAWRFQSIRAAKVIITPKT